MPKLEDDSSEVVRTCDVIRGWRQVSAGTLIVPNGVSVQAGDLVAVDRCLEPGMLIREADAVVATLRALAAFRQGGWTCAIGFVGD